MSAGIQLAPLMTEIRVDLQGFSTELDRAATLGTGAAQNIQNQFGGITAAGQGLQTVGANMTKFVTLPLVGLGAAAVVSAQSMEAAMRNFQGQTGKTTEELGKYRDVLENVYSNNWGESFDDVADSMAMINQQMGDMPTEQLESTTEAALALRDTFDIDINEGIRGANAMMNQFGITSDEAYSLMIQGAQKGLNQNEDLADQISEYSVYYKDLGFSVEDMFAAMETGTKNGVFQVDYMNDALKEFGIRSKVIDDSGEAFTALGLNAEETVAKFTEGGETANQTFKDVVKRLAETDDKVEQNALGVALFGTKWEDLGADAVLALANADSGIDKSKDALAGLNEISFTSLLKKLEVLGASFGDLILPTLLKVADKVGILIDKFTALDDSTKKIILTVGGIAAAIGPLLSIVGTIAVKGVALASTIGSISAAAGGAGISIAALAGPIGIAVAAIVGLVAAVATNFGGIRDTIASTLSAAKECITTVMGAIKQAWETDFMGLRTVVMTVFDAIAIVVNTVLGVIREVFNLFSSAFQGDWEGCWDAVKGIFSTIWGGIKSLLSTVLDALVKLIINIGIQILKAAYNSFIKIKEGAGKAWDLLMGWMKYVITDPVGAIKGIGSALFNAGKEIFTKLWEGMQNIWESIKNWFDETVKYIKKKFSEWLGTKEKMDDSGGGNKSKQKSKKADGSAYNGLSYVPFDGYIARLHKGERVLTAKENRAVANRETGQSSTPIQVNTTITLDGKVIGKAITPVISRELAFAARKG